MMSLRPPSSTEMNRRSRIKSVVSRRAISSRSSSGRHKSRSTTSNDDDEDLDVEAEDYEILSCFLEDDDDDVLADFPNIYSSDSTDRVPESHDTLRAEQGEIQLHQDEDQLSKEYNNSQDQAIELENDYYSDSSDRVQLRPKSHGRLRVNGSQIHSDSSTNNANGPNAGGLSKFSVEPLIMKNHVFHTEAKMDKNIDYTDMALARDFPSESDVRDIGLDRAEPILKKRVPRKSSFKDQPHSRPRIYKPTVQFGWFDIVIGIFAIIIFFVDIGTDIELAAHYFRQRMWVYGGVTTALIVCPSLVTMLLGLHWYVIDYQKEKEVVERIKRARKKAFVTPKYVWFIRFFITVVQMGPVLRIVAFLYYGYMSRNKHLSEKLRNRYYHFMLYEDVDSCLLRLFESFLESAPQLSWQLYIAMVLKENNDDDVVGTYIRGIALLSSWCSLAISLVSYHRSLRNSNEEKAKMKWTSVPFYFIWRASEIGGRVLCIATFASTFQLWVFLPLGFHWFFMSGWLMFQRTSFYKNTCQEKTFNVICGYVMIFCFLNLREGVTRYRFWLFYFFLYLENFLMLGFWFHLSPDLGEWYHLWGFVVVLILFGLHVIFQFLYYCFFHPTKNIQTCLQCQSAVIYESICYDIEATVDEYQSQPTESLVRKVTLDSVISHDRNNDVDVELRVTTV